MKEVVDKNAERDDEHKKRAAKVQEELAGTTAIDSV
jgi:hypothetical protein